MVAQPARGAFTLKLACPKCGAAGEAVWEKEKTGQCLAHLSGNFYERLAKFAPYKIEIVCHDCGGVCQAFGAQGPQLPAGELKRRLG